MQIDLKFGKQRKKLEMIKQELNKRNLIYIFLKTTLSYKPTNNQQHHQPKPSKSENTKPNTT